MTTTSTATEADIVAFSKYKKGTGQIRAFVESHYLHFNSREMVESAKAYEAHINAGGKMLVTLAGAMSTARIGRILSRMIREGKVHAISCTGANLEEDVFTLLAGNEYEHCPDWRALTAEQEKELYDKGFNRVTDTCIPETIMRHVEHRLYDLWDKAQKEGTRKYPFEYFWEVLGQSDLKQHYQVPAEDSWMLAAKEHNIPIVTPGWEDSTLGNMFAAWGMKRGIDNLSVMRPGTEAMQMLAHWYRKNCNLGTEKPSIGFFQIGGGIAGDFPICAVPMMIQDMEWEDTPFWGYFCQISDAVTSYGGYSGAVPNEKITWGKLEVATPKYMIQSDATIVAPLIFAYVLGD
ncbi:MAG: deoxyhypusine synthase family protein [Alphaproteobacteria bacterium]|nr:deoxyhypusine synthase family protein [Alphaproteobacteria bacterium]